MKLLWDLVVTTWVPGTDSTESRHGLENSVGHTGESRAGSGIRERPGVTEVNWVVSDSRVPGTGSADIGRGFGSS